MRKTTKEDTGKTTKQSLSKNQTDKQAYIERLKKVALYDAKDYLDILATEDGIKQISLKTNGDVDWDIVESLEVNDNKVKLKFPDRTKAMEKYGQVLKEANQDDEEITYIATFLGEDDGEEN